MNTVLADLIKDKRDEILSIPGVLDVSYAGGLVGLGEYVIITVESANDVPFVTLELSRRPGLGRHLVDCTIHIEITSGEP